MFPIVWVGNVVVGVEEGENRHGKNLRKWEPCPYTIAHGRAKKHIFAVPRLEKTRKIGGEGGKGGLDRVPEKGRMVSQAHVLRRTKRQG